MSLAVLDIDGVVADVRHRLHHLERRPKNWHGFFAGAQHDPPLAEGVALALDLAGGSELVWLTGRPEWLRSVTVSWLEGQGLPAAELHMRPAGDYRPARDYKLQALQRLADRSVTAFVDDDPVVVAAALDAGFPAVLADWVPHTATLQDAQEHRGRT